MLKIKKRFGRSGKDYTWQITGTLHGQQVRKSTGTSSKADAEAQLRALTQELDDRKRKGAHDCTFADAAIHYMKQGGEARFLPPLIREFGEMYISDMRAHHLSDYAEREKPGRKPSYICRIVYEPINAILASAHEAEMCEAKRFKKPKYKSDKRKPAPEWWIETIRKTASPRLSAFVTFTTVTGARADEACSLTTESFDWARLRVLIKETKTDTEREAPITPEMSDALARIWRDVAPGGSVFGFADQRAVNKAIKRLCKRLGIEAYTTHQFGRKAYTTRALRAGMSTKWIADSAGWATTRMVDEHYGFIEEAHIVEGMLKLSSQLAHPVHAPAVRASVVGADIEKKQVISGGSMVGGTGIEPVTPTMSRLCKNDGDDEKKP